MLTYVQRCLKKKTFKNDIQNKHFKLHDSVDESWQATETAIYNSAQSTYGVSKASQNEWAREYTEHLCHSMKIK